MMDIHYNDRNIHKTRLDHDLYDFSAFVARPKRKWPNGKGLAVIVAINVEFQDLIVGEDQWRPPGSPVSLDVRSWSHRDYGSRVGVFRLGKILSDLGVRATMPVSDAVLTRAPRVVEYASSLGWEFVGHGARTNNYVTSAMTAEQERAYLAASWSAIKTATGVAPRGWLGPAQSESHRTPVIAADVGFDYTLDWSNDDQPYEMHVPKGRMMALPASVETSDAYVIDQRTASAGEYEQVLRDHFDGLLAESASTALAMTVSLQAHRSGQPFRSSYIRRFLEHVVKQDGVWLATGSEVADAARTWTS